MIVSNGEALDFAPQALAETVPTLTNGWFYNNTGLNLANRFATFEGLYRVQPAIATVVDKIANSAARLSVKLWDLSTPGGRSEEPDSPLARLLRSPSSEMSPYNFWRWTFSTYEVYGEAFWRKMRDDSGRVVELVPMHPSRIVIRRDTAGNVVYVFSIGVAEAGLLEIPATDVVAFLRYNPLNVMRGMSRLEPLASTLANEDAARRANASWWNKGARPSVVLSHPGELSETAMDRIKQKFDARHAGADNMGGTAVLQEGMTATVVQLNAEEMQYIESRKLNMTEVCMVYDVPPPVVHILDHATFSNITEQMRSMYRDTMSPRLEDVESVLDHSLTQEFYPDGLHKVQFDMTDVLRGDFESRSTAAQTLRSTGIATGNEAREIMGLTRSSDAIMDKVFANAALVELGAPAQRVSVTEAVPADPSQQAEAGTATGEATQAATDAGKHASGVSFRSVMGRLARVKATQKDIRAALISEHQKALADFFDKQRAAVKAAVSRKASGVFDPTEWDPGLASLMHTLSAASAQAIGQKVAADLGGKYSADDIASWLKSNSEETATRVNQATADEISAALEGADDGEDPEDTVDGVFDGQIAARSNQISASRVALVAGLAALVAARQSNAKTKTWVTGGNPRSQHAAMDGETVPLGEVFSNGLDGPGDYSGGAAEVAGCNCTLDFN